MLLYSPALEHELVARPSQQPENCM